MRIDVHAHYFPTAYVELLNKLGRSDARGGQSSDMGRRIAALDQTEVDCQILSAVGMDTQIADARKALEAARYINDVYKELEITHGGRFQSFGWLPLPYVDEALGELERCLDTLGFRGIAFPCYFQGRPLDDPEFEPVWAALNQRKAVAYIHPVGFHSACHPGLSEFGLHTACGSPMQTYSTAIRLIYTGITTRYPDVKIIFAACAGYLPFMWNRLEVNIRRGLDNTAEAAVGSNFFSWMKALPLDHADPMSAFKRYYYDSSVQDIPAAMLLVKQSFGVDRLLLGSDEIFASLLEVVEYIRQDPYLSAEEKHAVLDVNAQQLLQLPPVKWR